MIELTEMSGKDARIAEHEVAINASGSPAIEVLYNVRGILLVEGQQADISELETRIRQ